MPTVMKNGQRLRNRDCDHVGPINNRYTFLELLGTINKMAIDAFSLTKNLLLNELRGTFSIRNLVRI